ncbi:coiled-coil domain-containing protein 160 [Spea bombifrons]|uniref:coiled-coil domain-containing protein 160 n=1 Tax=Spea bombifrons TaxID=233779 RepID=UPI00234A4BD5|nr:coiled-coil domain-containing protein 160 [Spea bombifrons]
MAEEKKHWVEELFPPHFSADDFLYQTFEPETLTSEKFAERRAKTLQNIYQNALQKTQQEEEERRRELLSKRIVRAYDLHVTETKPEQSNANQHETCRVCGGVNTSPPRSAESNGIWSSVELNVLRQEINRSQSEEARLKLKFDAYMNEMSELKAKYSKTLEELEAAKEALSISKRENECRKTQIKQFEKDLPRKEATIQDLRKDLHGKCVQVSSLNKLLAKAREDVQELQLKNKDFQQEMNTLKQQQELKNAISTEKLKLKYNVEINKLQKQIEILKEELTCKSAQHARDLIALDLLRKHFSSLSVNNRPQFTQLDIPPTNNR